MADRTQLAGLGFADRDKGPKHDLMCQFLLDPEQADELCGMFGAVVCASQTEFPISKGQNQYKTTIGFLDVLYKCHFGPRNIMREVSSAREYFDARSKKAAELKIDDAPIADQERFYREFPYQSGAIAVEVKTGVVSTGELIRQIGLYREHLGMEMDAAWVLATPTPLLEDDVRFLHKHGITSVACTGFESWVARRGKKLSAGPVL